MLTALTVLGGIGVGSAVAGQPEDPGCFGQDRAAYLHDNFQNGGMNRAYKTSCGGDPS